MNNSIQHGLQRVKLSLQQKETLQSFCNDHSIAVSRLWQLVWSIVLGSYFGSNHQASFCCILPGSLPAQQQQAWEEEVGWVEMVQDNPIMTLLKDDQTHYNLSNAAWQDSNTNNGISLKVRFQIHPLEEKAVVNRTGY